MEIMEANLLHEFIIKSSIYLKVPQKSFKKRVYPYISYPRFFEKLTFLNPFPPPPDTRTYVCISKGMKYQFLGKFCVRTTQMIQNGNRHYSTVADI